MKMLPIIMMFLSGCASMDEADKIFYIQHSIDVAQTLQISRSRYHTEVGLGTSSFMTEDPTVESVIAWGVATAVFYWAFEDKLPNWAKRANIGYRSYIVNSNFSNGLTVGSSSCRSTYE